MGLTKITKLAFHARAARVITWFGTRGRRSSSSKLAITMWSRQMAPVLGDDSPMIVAVNPASLLATKMVRQGFGMAGNDVGVGADILARAALSDEFADASGQYFDNDSQRFAAPHADALDPQRCAGVVAAIDAVLAELALGQEG